MSTSGFHEKLVYADVSQLSPPAFVGEDMAVLKGTPPQISYANTTRAKKLTEWKADLPQNVIEALKGIQDATWWLANKEKDPINIGWPESWIRSDRRNREATAPTDQPNLLESRSKVLNSKGPLPGTSEELENFEKFARKVCQSPELSYLTIMALMYRHSKNPFIIAKFAQARATVGGHLEAIDNILGSPGA